MHDDALLPRFQPTNQPVKLARAVLSGILSHTLELRVWCVWLAHIMLSRNTLHCLCGSSRRHNHTPAPQRTAHKKRARVNAHLSCRYTHSSEFVGGARICCARVSQALCLCGVGVTERACVRNEPWKFSIQYMWQMRLCVCVFMCSGLNA